MEKYKHDIGITHQSYLFLMFCYKVKEHKAFLSLGCQHILHTINSVTTGLLYIIHILTNDFYESHIFSTSL